jgi:hypothetical protein
VPPIPSLTKDDIEAFTNKVSAATFILETYEKPNSTNNPQTNGRAKYIFNKSEHCMEMNELSKMLLHYLQDSPNINFDSINDKMEDFLTLGIPNTLTVR